MDTERKRDGGRGLWLELELGLRIQNSRSSRSALVTVFYVFILPPAPLVNQLGGRTRGISATTTTNNTNNSMMGSSAALSSSAKLRKTVVGSGTLIATTSASSSTLKKTSRSSLSSLLSPSTSRPSLLLSSSKSSSSPFLKKASATNFSSTTLELPYTSVSSSSFNLKTTTTTDKNDGVEVVGLEEDDKVDQVMLIAEATKRMMAVSISKHKNLSYSPSKSPSILTTADAPNILLSRDLIVGDEDPRHSRIVELGKNLVCEFMYITHPNLSFYLSLYSVQRKNYY